jgi:hypothetical protein
MRSSGSLAGVTSPGVLHALREDHWRRTFNFFLMGPYNTVTGNHYIYNHEQSYWQSHEIDGCRALMAEFSLRDTVVFDSAISPPSSKLYSASLKFERSRRTIWRQFPATYRRSCSSTKKSLLIVSSSIVSIKSWIDFWTTMRRVCGRVIHSCAMKNHVVFYQRP